MNVRKCFELINSLFNLIKNLDVVLMQQKVRAKRENVSSESLFAETAVEVRPESNPINFAEARGLLFTAF